MAEAQKNKDEKKGIASLPNKYLLNLEHDFLYHLALGNSTHDLEKMFGDVKFVCIGGTPHRMKTFAHYIKNEIGYQLPEGTGLIDITTKSNRYAMYKVGPVLSVSHGIGMPSLSVLLHELIKLVKYAKCVDPVFIRIGTSGGIGVVPGTVVVTEEPLNGLLENNQEFIILGNRIQRPAILDKEFAKEFVQCSMPTDGFKTILGKTLATDDFYESQGRTDGAICDHLEEDKYNFLKKLSSIGVRNIEMECTMLAALTHRTGIKSAIVCVAVIDRLNGDQVTIPKESVLQFENRPQLIVGRYINKKIKNLGLL